MFHYGFSQYEKNGSFEQHGPLPFFISQFDSDWSPAGNYSWINRSIGFCQFPDNIFTPAPGQSGDCQNWYSPTYGSSDYFHRNCCPGQAHVKVPYLNMRVADYDEETRQPYGYETDNSQNAYCGIVLRSHVGTNVADYREYIQSQLQSTLQYGKYYKVSFKVSLSKHEAINCYIKKIGAYFSQDFVVCTYVRWTNWTDRLIVDNDNPSSFAKPQMESNFPLNTTADENGLGGWTTIEAVIDGNNYNFITIGNFEPGLRSYVPFPNKDFSNGIITFYFIDDLKIEEIVYNENCECGEPYYQVTLDAKPGQTDETKCCYKFKLKVLEDPENRSCPLVKFKIKAINPLNENDQAIIYEHDQALPKGTTIESEFCINKNPYGSNDPIIQFDYYNTINNVRCSTRKTIRCECKCAEYGELTDNIKIINNYSNGKCCFELWFENNTVCHFNLSPNLITITRLPDNYNGIEFIQGSWILKDYVFQNNHYKGFQRPDDYHIFPYCQPFLIGKICINDDGVDYNINIQASNNYEPNQDGSLNICPFNLNNNLKCEPTPEDCCDKINADFVCVDGSPHQPEILLGLKISQILSPSHDCDIYKLIVFPRGNRVNPVWTVESTEQGKPLYFNGTGGKIIRTFIADYDFLNNVYYLNYDVCFYKFDGTLICCKEVPFYSHPNEGRESIEPDKINIENINKIFSLYNFKLNPNPVNDELNISFGLKDKSHIIVEVYNSVGEKINKVYDGFLDINENHSFKVTMKDNAKGNYIVKISCNRETFSLPFILIK